MDTVTFGRNPRSVSRVACAYFVFPAGVDKTIYRVFFSRRYFVPGVPSFFETFVVAHIMRRLATTLDSLCRDKLGVHFITQV